MRRIVLFAVMAICSTAAHASSWRYLNAASDDMVAYFDAESVVKKGNTVTLWIKYVNEPNTPDSDGSYSSAQKMVYFCKKRTSQVLTSTSYDKSKKIIRAFSK